MFAFFVLFFFFFFQAEDGIRDAQESRGLGDVYKRQVSTQSTGNRKPSSMPTLRLSLVAGLAICLFQLQSASSECITATGVDDGSNGALDSGTLNLPGDVLPAILPLLPVGEYETPIQFRLIQHFSLVVFSGLAAFHPTSLDHFADVDQSNARRRCALSPANLTLWELQQDLAVAYGLYFAAAKLFPSNVAFVLNTTAVTWGLEAGFDRCQDAADCADLSTPWGLAYNLAEKMAVFAARDGWNADGTLSRTYNRRPFQDFRDRPYTPRNTPWKLKHARRWQPLLEDNGKGYMVHQEHVVPHAGHTGRGIFMSDQEHCSFKAPRPNIDYDTENDNVLARAAALDDTKKMQVELFDGKIGSILPLLFQWYVRTTGKKLSGYEFQKIDCAINNILYESTMAVWREKIRHDRVRPPSRIRHDMEGETVTSYAGPFQGIQTDVPAEDWEPYIRTMPHAEYPSASSCLCEAFAEYMRLETGADDFPTMPQFPGVPGPSFLAHAVLAGSSTVEPGQTPAADLTFAFFNWSQISHVCGQSRLDGGMHYEAAVPAGADLCRGIAAKVKASFDALESGNRPAHVVDFKHQDPEFKQDRCKTRRRRNVH
eukprot:TRINITY_DN2945_c0_g1_i1.p1 TRINITY_DN2945_c0_g1~~TRINITY_DN2945_c0_g1_i1.p1  ORF type:complete len:598 (-),score=119.45 TRINITY_DN2945_c0_g1_i1:434-2227(-)